MLIFFQNANNHREWHKTYVHEFAAQWYSYQGIIIKELVEVGANENQQVLRSHSHLHPSFELIYCVWRLEECNMLMQIFGPFFYNNECVLVCAWTLPNLTIYLYEIQSWILMDFD